MVDATMNKQETVKKPISTASVADNITFETLLDTQFLHPASIRLLNYNHK